ncbi:MAG TPA: cellulose biosynthesis cyclic di-GMP-binding regulatory protein BcsB [Steroidobacteraceae bacterium]|nr:cellulose biosynthesis cyclic di-GMP-binding regulatory protein BcsB [Steroidobacteraceae bacterium]
MDTVKSRSGGLAASLLSLALGSVGQAAQPAASQGPPVREVRATFAQLGAGAMTLEGVTATGAVNFGIRADQLVSGGTLHLLLTASPALLQDLSHIRVTLNNQTVAAVPLTRADAGHPVERAIPLDPRYFSDYNHIQLDFIGHYTTACEDPQHSSLWVKVSDESDVTLEVRPLELRDELALLPAPFFDAHDNRELVLPIVLAAHAPRGVLRSAGVAASWFGMLADYRGARFPVSFDALPARHALVFATNDSRPAGLTLAAVTVPTVSVVDNPADSTVKLLVFQGRDEAQLRQAVEGLVLGNPVLSGSSATVEAVSYRRRAAYDAPRWLRSDRPVRLGELIDGPGQLEGQGVAPQPMAVNLRLPPDLFTWNKSGVPVDVHYRYTAPAERDNSVLTVSINDQLLRSYRLLPETEAESSGRLLVPLLQSDSARQSRGILIPAFQLASDNRMVFQFSMDFHREANCKQVFIDNTREAIDPDSTVDISGFAHYTALPNLALFANSGFPFTRYADLAETAFVLPDAGDAAALEEMYFLLGRMGRQTGATALAFQVLDVREALAARDLDLLILSGSGAEGLLQQWQKDLPLTLTQLGRDYRALAPATRMAGAPLPADSGAHEPPHVEVQAAGALAALVGFESPLGGGRSVVALLGRDAAAAHALVAALDDNARVPLIRGGLAVIRNDAVQSFEGAGLYYVGSLPFWQWFWFHFSQHAWLLILLALAIAVAAGLLVYGALERRVQRRLEGQGK